MTDIARWTKRAEAGDPDAMWEVALAYLCGWGVEQDIAKGDYWCEKWIQTMEELANNGDTGAMWEVALAYEFGSVVYPDLEKSREWTKRLQEQAG